ncbi:hypothetical protein [Candidatus Methylomirabilis sp.]
MVKSCASPIAAPLRMKPPYERIVLEKRESRTVAALRDALLRKLLSEELRMRTAEKLLEVE